MPYAEPLDTAVRKATYGHHDWLFWRDCNGLEHIARVSADTLKAAMMATGTQGYFTLISGTQAHFHRMSWRLAIRHWRNAKRGWL